MFAVILGFAKFGIYCALTVLTLLVLYENILLYLDNFIYKTKFTISELSKQFSKTS